MAATIKARSVPVSSKGKNVFWRQITSPSNATFAQIQFSLDAVLGRVAIGARRNVSQNVIDRTRSWV